MSTQAVRLTICRTPQEIGNAKARDQTLGFAFVADSTAEDTNVGMLVNIPANGQIRELFVHIDANAQPPPPPPTVSPPLTLVISSKP